MLAGYSWFRTVIASSVIRVPGAGIGGSPIMDSEITRYIRENRDRNTRKAIEARLIRAGYSPTEIDALWPPDDEQRPPAPQGRAFWRPFILSVIGMYGITFLVYAITTLVWTDESIWAIILTLLFLFLLSAGSISVDIVRRKRSA